MKIVDLAIQAEQVREEAAVPARRDARIPSADDPVEGPVLARANPQSASPPSSNFEPFESFEAQDKAQGKL
jgi:hypothetical protein